MISLDYNDDGFLCSHVLSFSLSIWAVFDDSHLVSPGPKHSGHSFSQFRCYIWVQADSFSRPTFAKRADKHQSIQWTITSQLNDVDFADDLAIPLHKCKTSTRKDLTHCVGFTNGPRHQHHQKSRLLTSALWTKSVHFTVAVYEVSAAYSGPMIYQRRNSRFWAPGKKTIAWNGTSSSKMAWTHAALQMLLEWILRVSPLRWTPPGRRKRGQPA